MNKVSWTNKEDLFRATTVVLTHGGHDDGFSSSWLTHFGPSCCG